MFCNSSCNIVNKRENLSYLFYQKTIIGFVSYGIFNTLGHDDGKTTYNWLIGILSAGEGQYDVHHANILGRYN